MCRLAWSSRMSRKVTESNTKVLAADRHRRIIELIERDGSVQVAGLVEEFGVSRMTINRDLDHLAASGVLAKVHGGAMSTAEPAGSPSHRCLMCGIENGCRTTMTLFHEGGTRSQACCPHCGLMLLAKHPDVTAALAQDFIGGQMVNIRSATFLVEPDTSVCCVPTVLCFEVRDDAEKFSQGFGGVLMTWEEAQADVHEHMTLLKRGTKMRGNRTTGIY